MSKLYHEPIEVEFTKDGFRSFRWRGNYYRIQRVCGLWRERHGWWSQEGEVERLHLRVEVHNQGIYDLYRDRAKGRWYLERIWD
ncbi:hypothetical protein HKBW3S25_01719 [Candidatus Hakubella thermalkaliphila]|uniref:DUF6504 domain-containing protein n=1 Tax=Candidatus Hakubella thermalkaliphila TaxID=2754717 RepID=A0A6V8P156_9ACTN|nr:hypothetical protein HKBW3S25_01719 [Candidatus Hakubella thermalkaliphila]